MLRSLLAAALGLAASLLVTGCASDISRSTPSAPAADTVLTTLARHATLVGVALDVYTAGPGDAFPPQAVSRPLLADAGVDMPAGLSVHGYAYATTPSRGTFRYLANREDAWQFCLDDSDGGWVTYGETTGVQAYGTPGDEPGSECTFTGTRHPDAHFDPRLFAQAAWKALHAQDDDFTYPTALDPDTLADLGLEQLPAGWSSAAFEQRGWTAVQYCLTAPDGDWYRVHDRAVAEYGTGGRCELNPDMPAW